MALSQKDKQEICNITAFTIIAVLEKYKNLLHSEKATVEFYRRKVARRLKAYPQLKRNIERCKLDIADLYKEEFNSSPVVRHIQDYYGNDLTVDEIRHVKITTIQRDIDRDQKEIDIIDKALAELKDDGFYEIIPALYFDNRHIEDLTSKLYCNKVTIYRHKKRLLDKLSICLYGADVLA